MEIYHLSDKAYNRLCRLAEGCKFIKGGTARKAGISNFFTALSYRVYKDARPEDFTQYDDYMIENWRTPIWAKGLETRRQRALVLPETALTRFTAIAIQHRIFVGRDYRGGPYHKSQVAITAAVLECIGLELLVPINGFPMHRDWMEMTNVTRS